jgi:hypothetical protein
VPAALVQAVDWNAGGFIDSILNLSAPSRGKAVLGCKNSDQFDVGRLRQHINGSSPVMGGGRLRGQKPHTQPGQGLEFLLYQDVQTCFDLSRFRNPWIE